jgi:hypothetical protein
MTGQDADLVRLLHDVTVSETRRRARPPNVSPSGPLAREWVAYHRELERLLADGHGGRFALMRRDDVVAVYDALEQASAAARERFGADSYLVLIIQPANGPFRPGGGLCRD